MAYKKTSTNGQVQYNVDEYFIDTPDDLQNLPKTSVMGSLAICLSNGEVYAKNSAGEWKIFGEE